MFITAVTFSSQDVFVPRTLFFSSKPIVTSMEFAEDHVRSEEDKIIESLVVEGTNELYVDHDFLPIRQSLYNVETIVPTYDDDVSENIL